jgi:large subunit ribosomal protein L4
VPSVDLYNIEGQKVGEIGLKDEIFGIKVNEDVLHIVVLNQLANKRQGTHSTKTKSEVRGGGAKPWRQKGTGRARQGSIRSAQWIKGGIIFGPKPRSYNYTVPKKVRRLALKSALSSKVESKEIIILDELKLKEVKTKEMVKVLKNLKIDNSALIVLPTINKKIDDMDNVNVIKNVEIASRNIPGIKTSLVNTINVYDILKYKKLILTKESLSSIEEVYA